VTANKQLQRTVMDNVPAATRVEDLDGNRFYIHHH